MNHYRYSLTDVLWAIQISVTKCPINKSIKICDDDHCIKSRFVEDYVRYLVFHWHPITYV